MSISSGITNNPIVPSPARAVAGQADLSTAIPQEKSGQQPPRQSPIPDRNSTTSDEELDALLAAAMTRMQALIGANDSVNQDTNIDYAALAKVIADQQAKLQQEQGVAAKASVQPVQLLDILA